MFPEEQVILNSKIENQTAILHSYLGLISTNQIGLIKDSFENQTDLIKDSFENQTDLIKDSFKNQTALLKEDTVNQNYILNHILEHSHNIEDYVKGTITTHQQIEGKIK